jgi:ribosomal protein S18 acetylase RimI-like enzyme
LSAWQRNDMVKIRPARLNDLPNLMALLCSCVRQMLSEGIDQWDKIYPDEATCAGDIERRELFLLERDSRISGIITLNEFQDPAYREVPWHYSSKALVIHRLAVDPACQGQGIAGELMQFAREYARQQRYATIRLDAFAGNPRALALYERLGYRLAGSVLFRKGVFYCFEIQVV